jgi:hypothetical protein
MAERNYGGGCHCGKVRFEVATDPAQAIACNCSHCAKAGLWLTFVTPDKFRLLSSREVQTEYRFNKHVIEHLFCAGCGVQSYANGKMPDGNAMVAINVRCLDDIDISTLSPKPFDGRSL